MKRLMLSLAALLAVSPTAFGENITFVSTPYMSTVNFNKGATTAGGAMIGMGNTISIPGVSSAASAYVVAASGAYVIKNGQATIGQVGTVQVVGK